MTDSIRAMILSDDEWNARSGVERELSMEIRVQSPFKVDKDFKNLHDDGEYEIDDGDVVIRGPVYVGDEHMLDRHSELVDMKAIFDAWAGYQKNPVILYNHSKTDGVIGRMIDVEMGAWDGIEGDVPIGRAIIDGGEEAITRKIRKGFLRAFSIGFIAKAAVKECLDEDMCYIRFTEIEWLETSVVDVPASPNALFSVEKHILGYEDMGDRIAVLFAKPEDDSTPSDDEVAIDIDSDNEESGKSSSCGCNHNKVEPDEEREEVSPIGTFGIDENEALEARLSLIEAFIEASEGKSSDTNSFNTPLQQPLVHPEPEMTTMTETEIIAKSEEAEELVEEVLAEEVLEEEVLEEATEEVVEATEELAEEELVEEELVEEEVLVEEAVSEEVVEVKSTDDLLFGIVKTLSNIDTRIAELETKFSNPDMSEEVALLSATIAEHEATILSLTEEKNAAEAEAAIEAEVSKRVASVIGQATSSTSKHAAAPKSLVASLDKPAKKSGMTQYDPVPEVTAGMNGLAGWLQNQIERRGA
tara:strand:- start:1693 stop:3279 length:1587 start_codon:yes stop_codon:yes gene_type:complete